MKIDSRPPAADRNLYYAEARTWSQDVNGSLRASRRVAWIVAGCACAVAVAEGLALAALVPLKTVVPYTITVDRQTGYLETAQALRPGALAQDVAVTHAFLAQYVMARETFDAADLQANYRKVTAWSSGAARTGYVQAMQTSNAQSPVNLYPRTTQVATTIKSISLLSPTSALVRFETERADAGVPVERRAYAAIVGFRYTGEPMRMEDRFNNPLGFQVTSYRRDSETVAGSALPATAPAAAQPVVAAAPAQPSAQ